MFFRIVKFNEWNNCRMYAKFEEAYCMLGMILFLFFIFGLFWNVELILTKETRRGSYSLSIYFQNL